MFSMHLANSVAANCDTDDIATKLREHCLFLFAGMVVICVG